MVLPPFALARNFLTLKGSFFVAFIAVLRSVTRWPIIQFGTSEESSECDWNTLRAGPALASCSSEDRHLLRCGSLLVTASHLDSKVAASRQSPVHRKSVCQSIPVKDGISAGIG